MRWRTQVFLLTCLTISGSPCFLQAEEASLGKDLTATIALHGMPCDKVIGTKRNSDSDYTAACRDGNRYHVYVDATGHVVVKKL
jgi:hypothetical protein